METVILDRVVEVAKRRYGNRSDEIIYVHQLVYPARRGEPRWNGYMAVGELIHMAVPALLGDTGELCRFAEVRVRPVDGLERYVRRGFVVVCGHPDAVVDGRPVEVKSTRRDLRRPEARWALQAELYAWLARSEAAYLVLIDLLRARERVFECPAVDGTSVVEEWLAGGDPVVYAKPCSLVEEVDVEGVEGKSLKPTRTLDSHGASRGREGPLAPVEDNRERVHARRVAGGHHRGYHGGRWRRQQW